MTGVQTCALPILRFADDGPGLRSEVVQRLFEPFFTTKQKGTGLGMAIVQRILLAHGGTVAASNGSAGGAEIALLLPRFQGSRNSG